MDRTHTSRFAFLNRNIRVSKKSHAKKLIHRDIHENGNRVSKFNLPDIILGGQDGLVNVLGVILGVAAATSSNQMVIIAGLAATFAESFSMAAVAYTSRLAEADYYKSERERERWEIEHVPDGEKEEIRALYENYGFKGNLLDSVVDQITSNRHVWLKVMMEQELKLEQVNRREAIPTAVIVGLAALLGSFIPLVPFFFVTAKDAMYLSLFFTSATLFGIGYYKAKVTFGRNFIKQGIEMTVIGMVSALVGYIVGLLLR